MVLCLLCFSSTTERWFKRWFRMAKLAWWTSLIMVTQSVFRWPRSGLSLNKHGYVWPLSSMLVFVFICFPSIKLFSSSNKALFSPAYGRHCKRVNCPLFIDVIAVMASQPLTMGTMLVSSSNCFDLFVVPSVRVSVINLYEHDEWLVVRYLFHLLFGSLWWRA